MGLRYSVPLPGPFYYSGRVGPGNWLPRSRHTGTGPMGFIVGGAGRSLGVSLFSGLCRDGRL